MTVYVDEPFDYGEMVQGRARRWGTVWSHLMADSEEELVAFALRLGLSASYLQKAGTRFAHFDIIPSKRQLALRLGAKPLSVKELVRLRRGS